MLASSQGTENVDSIPPGNATALLAKVSSLSNSLPSAKEQQATFKGIERRIAAYYSAQDDMGLVHYLDSVLLHVELSASRGMELKLRQSISLRESRDLDRAISVGHEVLVGAKANNLISLQAKAMTNLAYCYSYAGLYKKAEEWENRSFTFANQHGYTSEIIKGLKTLGYQKMNAKDYDGTRETFSKILSLCKNDPLGNNVAFAKGGMLNAYVFEGDFYSEAALKLLSEVKALSERPEPFPSAHGRRDLLGILCNYYTISGQPQTGMYYGRAHLAHVRKFSSDTSEIVRFALKELYPVEASAQDYKAAYQTLLRLKEIDQVMVERSQADKLAEASVKLDLYNHEIARQAAELTAQMEEEAKNDRTWLLFVISLLAFAIITGTLFAYRRLYRDRMLIGQQNAIVSQSLSEKEVLLREIHHRVKNNLQIISSLLQKQARFSSDGDAQRLAKEGQERIQSMALIHENLYQSEQLSGVNIRSYLEDLGANISRSHSRPGSEIQLELAVADEYLDLDTAIPVGLILNELLTNAYKYAFPDAKAGLIKVSFQKPGDQFQLQISDNGVGLPADHAARSSKSLGHNLVKGLVRQLEGTIKWLKPEQGTTVQIEF